MVAPIQNPAPAAPKQDAAERVSAYFMRQLLAEAKVGEGLVGDSSSVGGHFADMMRNALANAMSEGDGLGLGAALSGEMPKSATADQMSVAVARIQAHAHIGHADARLAVSPVSGRLSSPFGLRTHPITGEHRMHEGVDIAAPVGTPVLSAGPGVVRRAETAGGYGNLVVVDHGHGVETRYAHLSSIDVEVGDRIEAGTQIGGVGSTGMSTGPHLHFEVRRDGRAENPQRVVSGLNASVGRSR